MSRLMRRGRREIPSLLNLARTPAALVEKVEAFSPRYSHAPLSARFYSTTLILPEATALPSPVMMILTTAEFATTTAPITQTPVPTSLAGSASATQTPTIAILPVASNTASLLENAATTGGDTGTPLPANVDPQNNTMVITVVAGIAGFTALSLGLFMYVRKRRVPSEGNSLDEKRAQVVARTLARPYSSQARL